MTDVARVSSSLTRSTLVLALATVLSAVVWFVISGGLMIMIAGAGAYALVAALVCRLLCAPVWRRWPNLAPGVYAIIATVMAFLTMALLSVLTAVVLALMDGQSTSWQFALVIMYGFVLSGVPLAIPIVVYVVERLARRGAAAAEPSEVLAHDG